MISLAEATDPSGVLDAHQAFMERRFPVMGTDHRLIGKQDAPVIQCGDDLLGRADIVLAHLFALDIRLIGEE